MKLLKNKFALTLMITMVFLVTVSCDRALDAAFSDDDGGPDLGPESDIVDTAIADGRFTTLVAALAAAGLVDALRAPGPLTVFAPTDDAFANLPPGTLDTLLDPANQELLTDILLYHVTEGALFAADVVALNGGSVTMLNGGTVTIDVVDGNVILNIGGAGEATVIITDIECSNGVIHVIDTVLDPND